MGRAKLAMLLPVAALVAAVIPGGSAQAATTAAQATTFTCYPNTPAAFDFTSSAVVDKQVTTTPADGTKLPGGYVAQSDPPNYFPSKTTGPLFDSFTNHKTQKTIYRNDSGTTWFTYDPAPKVPGALATGTFIGTGNGADSFGPKSLAALKAAGIHEPALVFVHGLLVMHFAVDSSGPYVTSFSLRGTQQNGCALLAGRP